MSTEPVRRNRKTTEIIISTIILSVFFLYIGHNPRTGTILTMARGVFTLATGLSLLSIAIKAKQFAWCMHKNKSYPVIQFIRPITLSILGTIFLFTLTGQEKEAIIFLEKQAEIATSLCNAAGKCPESMEGWVKYDSRYKYTFTSSGNTVFNMYYVARGEIFNVYINYGLDAGYRLNGGVKRQVSKGWKDTP